LEAEKIAEQFSILQKTQKPLAQPNQPVIFYLIAPN